MRWIIGAVFLLSLMVSPVSAATLTVGDTGDYQTIQGAIDNATDGDVIEIQEGIYQEQITVDKNLTLVGQGDVVINASEYVVQMDSENVTIQNIEIRRDLNRDTGSFVAGNAMEINQNMSHLELETVRFNISSSEEFGNGYINGRFAFEPYDANIDRVEILNTTVRGLEKANPSIYGLTANRLVVRNYSHFDPADANDHFRMAPYRNAQSEWTFENINISQADEFNGHESIFKLGEGGDLNITIRDSNLGNKMMQVRRLRDRNVTGSVVNITVVNSEIDRNLDDSSTDDESTFAFRGTQNDYEINLRDVYVDNMNHGLVGIHDKDLGPQSDFSNEISVDLDNVTVTNGAAIQTESYHAEDVTRFGEVTVHNSTLKFMKSVYTKRDSPVNVADKINITDSYVQGQTLVLTKNTTDPQVDLMVNNSTVPVYKRLARPSQQQTGIRVDGSWVFRNSTVTNYQNTFNRTVNSQFNELVFLDSDFEMRANTTNVTFRRSTTDDRVVMEGQYLNSSSEGTVVLRDGIVRDSNGTFVSSGGYIGVNGETNVSVVDTSGIINMTQNVTADPFVLSANTGNISNVTINSSYLVWQSTHSGTLTWSDVDNPVLLDEQSVDSPENYANGTHQVFYGSTENMSGDTSPDNQVDVPSTDETFDIEIPLIGIVVLCLLGTGYLVRKN